MNRIKIQIVEDDIIICQDLQEHLESMDYEISGVAYDAEDAIMNLVANKPDLVLLDINLGNGKDGIEVAEYINEKHQIPFIFLTSYANKSTIDRAKHCRPAGYIVKPFTEEDLFANIEIGLFKHAEAFNIESWNLEKINQRCKARFTPKEVAILQDIFEGKTNRQLSEKHFVSLSTIKTHVVRIYGKLDVHSRSEAMAKLRKQLG